MFKPTKRRGIALGLFLSLALATGAYAYWTAGGTGSGSGTTASGTSALTAVQTTSLSAMYPGDSPQTISGNFNNPNSSAVFVNTVTVSIASVSASGTCDASDFTLTGAAMAVNSQVAAGSGVGAFTGATIQFNNKATNQDGCKNATVNLSYAIS